MDTLHISAGDILTIEWAAGDTLELVDNAIFVMPENPNSGGSAVDSVNGQTGEVVLSAADVGADVAGSAQAVSEALQPQVTANAQAIATKASTTALAEVRGLAESNEQKLSTKAEQVDLEALGQVVSEKVDQATYNAFVQACALLASRDFVIEQINGILGGVSIDFDTLKEIADRLQLDSDQFGAITNALSKRIRFDAPQTLTSGEQQQARDNINAETKGTAAALVGAITPASIGAATAAQGAKANTALQSGDVAPVALSGSFWDLVNKTKIFDVGFAAYAVGTNAVFAVGDTLGVMLGKAQGQINALWTALADKADAANTLTLLGQKVNSALLGVPSGVATLGSDGILTAAQRPAASGSADVTLMGTGTGLQIGSFLPGMYFDSAGLQPAAAGQVSAFTTGKCLGIVFSQTVRIGQIGFNVTSGSGASVVLNIGIYSAHPTHGFPYQRVGGAVNVPVTATGIKMVTLDFTFEKNKVYWFRLGSNNSSLSISAHTPNYCFGSGESLGFLGPNQSPATIIHGPNNSGQDYPNSQFFIYTSGNGTTEQQPNMLNFIAATAIPKILFKVYS